MSDFKFACPVCGQHITCDSGSSGTQMDCPTCFRKLVVPQAKSAGATSLVLTAALAQSRLATSVSSQTDVIARSRTAKKFPVAAIALFALIICAGVVFAFREAIFHSQPPPSSPTNQLANAVPPVMSPAPGATNWTLSLAEAKIPEAAAHGSVHGRPFQLERAVIQQGRLDLRQGPKWPPDLGVSVHLFAERTEDLAGRTVTIEASRPSAPRVILRWKDEQGGSVTKDYRQGYALKVEFGAVTNNRLPGKVYIALPDDARSYAAGTFSAEIRRPAPKK